MSDVGARPQRGGAPQREILDQPLILTEWFLIFKPRWKTLFGALMITIYVLSVSIYKLINFLYLEKGYLLTDGLFVQFLLGAGCYLLMFVVMSEATE